MDESVREDPVPVTPTPPNRMFRNHPLRPSSRSYPKTSGVELQGSTHRDRQGNWTPDEGRVHFTPIVGRDRTRVVRYPEVYLWGPGDDKDRDDGEGLGVSRDPPCRLLSRL